MKYITPERKYYYNYQAKTGEGDGIIPVTKKRIYKQKGDPTALDASDESDWKTAKADNFERIQKKNQIYLGFPENGDLEDTLEYTLEV